MRRIILCFLGFARGILLLGWACAWPNPCAGQSSAVAYSKEMESKAQAGDTEAQFQLGNCYFFGLGVAKKQIDGVAWYRKVSVRVVPGSSACTLVFDWFSVYVKAPADVMLRVP